MHLRLILAAAAALFLGVQATPAGAQATQAKTVSACGTPGNTPVVGNSYPITMDQTGVLCTSSTGGGGGGSSATAAASGTVAVVAGVNKPIAIDLFSSTSVLPKDTQGDPITDATNDAIRANVVVALPTGSNTIGSIANISGTVSLPTGASTAALQGAQGTGSTYNPPTGGSGEIGYLSGIYAAAIDPTAVAVTGSGTAGTAATGVVSVQGIASMTPVQVSQATAANLNATVIGAGSAGTANAGVMTVQGITSMTPIQVSQATATNLNAQVVGTVADDGVASGNPVQVAAKYTATMPTFADGDVAQLRSTIKGNLIVGGLTADDAAAPAAASDYPVPMGGKYNLSAPTYTDGDRAQAQFDSKGNLKMSIVGINSATSVYVGTPIDDNPLGGVGAMSTTSVLQLFDGSTFDRARNIGASFGTGSAGVMAVEKAGSSWTHISANVAVTNIKGTPGILHSVCVNTLGASANALSLYDTATTGTGSPIAIIDTTAASATVCKQFDLGFTAGLAYGLATGTAADITISWR